MKLRRLAGDEKLAYLFIFLPLLIVYAFWVYPIIDDFRLSFFDTPLTVGFAVSHFVGLGNYGQIVQDPLIPTILNNVFFFAGSTILLTNLVALGIALLLNMKLKVERFLRTIFLIPWAIPEIVNAAAYQWIFNGTYGPFVQALRSLGLVGRNASLNILGDPVFAMLASVYAQVWAIVPFYSLLFLAFLQTIPPERYKAAEVDGASRLRKFIHITLPGIKGGVFLVLIWSTMYAMKAFTIVFGLTGGGPNNGTMIYTLYTWQQGFQFFHFGYAAALAATLGLMIIALQVIYLLAFRPGFEIKE